MSRRRVTAEQYTVPLNALVEVSRMRGRQTTQNENYEGATDQLRGLRSQKCCCMFIELLPDARNVVLVDVRAE